MSANAALYNDLLVKWEEKGGKPLKDYALTSSVGQLFQRAVSSPRAYQAVMAALDDLCEDDANRGLLTWLQRTSQEIKIGIVAIPAATLRIAPATDVVAVNSPATAPAVAWKPGYGSGDPPEFTAALQEISEIWLENVEHPEDPEGRPQALRNTAAKFTLPVVMAAIRYYSKRVRTGNAGLPYHLVNFLTKDGSAILKDWIRLSSAEVSEEAVTAFDSVWGKYPPFPEKAHDTVRDTAWSLYYQFVAPADRFGFTAAVESYRESRIGEDQQYTTRFANFIPNWRHTKAAEVASLLLGRAARDVLVSLAPSPYHEPRSRDTAQTMDYWCIVKETDYPAAVSGALGSVRQWLPEGFDRGPDSDVVREIIETAHRLSFTFCRAIVVQKPE